mmetsp:Transcript_18345/g.40534  ORF Transcript_18345/g.40534 Transcript_18345/m.40534 type:complete len:297 (+) Transcript_18345:126-1016(+)
MSRRMNDHLRAWVLTILRLTLWDHLLVNMSIGTPACDLVSAHRSDCLASGWLRIRQTWCKAPFCAAGFGSDDLPEVLSSILPDCRGLQKVAMDKVAISRSVELVSKSLRDADCVRWISTSVFHARGCSAKYPFLVMLASELGRELVVGGDIAAAAFWLGLADSTWEEMNGMPYYARFGWKSLHELNFNEDYYPGAFPSPIWKRGLENSTLVPLAVALEIMYPVIRRELDSILSQPGLFDELHFEHVNAEGQVDLTTRWKRIGAVLRSPIHVKSLSGSLPPVLWHRKRADSCRVGQS